MAVMNAPYAAVCSPLMSLELYKIHAGGVDRNLISHLIRYKRPQHRYLCCKDDCFVRSTDTCVNEKGFQNSRSDLETISDTESYEFNPSRRNLINKCIALHVLANVLQYRFAATAIAEEMSSELVSFEDSLKGFKLSRPSSFEYTTKAGADAYFRDPNIRGLAIGITILPVSISSLEQFGSLQATGQRLLETEKAKESTISASMLTQEERSTNGIVYYDFEYETNTTRGKKIIICTVTIVNSKLWILNGTIPCKADSSCDRGSKFIDLIRQSALSFQVLS